MPMPKFLRLVAAIIFTLVLPAPTLAAPYPSRNVEIIVSYGAGGSTDIVARIVAQALQERLGQSFIVVNRPGANGTIGFGQAMRATPDGYTLAVGYTAESVVVPQISAAAKYSVVDDFEPIAITGLVPVVLTVSKNIKADSLKDFIAEVRANPGKYTYGGGHASPPHIMGAWMNKIRNLDVRHVPYRGGAQAVNDMVGGHIDMFYGGIAVSKAAIDSGTVKALAVSGETRSRAAPNVPTFKEAGVPEFDLASWTVMLAPKGTPPDIVVLLRKETLSALDEPKTRDALTRQGVEKSDTQDVRAFLKGEQEKYDRVVRALGITMGQ
jgi:tripartite-type tricarboxylate transporter receptor subunit TctC